MSKIFIEIEINNISKHQQKILEEIVHTKIDKYLIKQRLDYKLKAHSDFELQRHNGQSRPNINESYLKDLEHVERWFHKEMIPVISQPPKICKENYKKPQKKIDVNINSLISELKIEVRQCNCCNNSNQYLEISEKLENLVKESILKAISNVQDTFLETSDSNSPHSTQGKEHH